MIEINFLTTLAMTLGGNKFLVNVLPGKVIYVKMKASPSIVDFKRSVYQRRL